MLERCRNGVLLGLLLSSAAVLHAEEILRDPTRPYLPAARVAAKTPEFAVNAIIVSSERKVAIVNGQRVGIGGTVDGATVVSIEKHQLVLDQDGKRMTLGLNNGAARR